VEQRGEVRRQQQRLALASPPPFVIARVLFNLVAVTLLARPAWSFVHRVVHRLPRASSSLATAEAVADGGPGGLVMSSKYNAMVRNLYQVNMWQPVKYGLGNSEALYRLLGSTLASKPVFHIAGTNGKGSVAWKISKALRVNQRHHSPLAHHIHSQTPRAPH
jgi:hypothetical protein